MPLALLLAASARSTAEAPRVVGYFAAWSIYGRHYHVSDIPADLLTHVNYAFAQVTPAGQCASIDPHGDQVNFPQLRELKKRHPRLETLISVGGASHSGNFSRAASTAESRRALAESCVRFMKEAGFEGIDVDWEFPSGDVDKKSFTALLAELRTQLDMLEVAENKHYLLTVAGPAGPGRIANLELDKISASIDWINLMAYDFHMPSDPVTNFDAPLYPSSTGPGSPEQRASYNVDAAVNAYLAAGIAPAKLNLGVHFSGWGWRGVPKANHGLYQRSLGPAKGKWGAGVFDYREIKNRLLKHYARYWHRELLVPWLYNPARRIMISYEDPESLGRKAEYIKRRQLGGVMIWQLGADDERHSLLGALHARLRPSASSGLPRKRSNSCAAGFRAGCGALPSRSGSTPWPCGVPG
ncbi:MAG TPA: glycoside hydrolase family 18 protein [Candidatus Acidoferrales bacterium]|nr:glycoside hydrolase family 18 protein [Candidatus Acidoferrales bacterium]